MALIFRRVQVPLQYSRVVEPFLPAINSQLEDRRMRDFDAALCHHLHKISIRQPISDVPAHAQLDDVGHRIPACDTSGHGRSASSFSTPARERHQSTGRLWMHQNQRVVRWPESEVYTQLALRSICARTKRRLNLLVFRNAASGRSICEHTFGRLIADIRERQQRGLWRTEVA